MGEGSDPCAPLIGGVGKQLLLWFAQNCLSRLSLHKNVPNSSLVPFAASSESCVASSG